MGSALAAALALAARDIRAELRSRSAFTSALVFAALVLVVINFARDPTRLGPADLAPSALWITIAFAAMTTLNRGFAIEKEHDALDLLRLAPVAREAVIAGKLLANLAFVFAVEAVTLPLFVLFFNRPVGHILAPLLLVMVLGTAGFVAVGTLFSAMAVRTRFAELMLPVLLLPFMLPPVVGAVQVTARLFADRPLSEVAGWLRLLAVYDIVFATVSVLIYPAVSDE